MDFKLVVSPTTVQNISKVDTYRGIWAAELPVSPDRLERFRADAEVVSPAAACRMAGIRVTDAEVAAILSGKVTPLRETSEVLGYAKALGR